jgi:hypothetical protein
MIAMDLHGNSNQRTHRAKGLLSFWYDMIPNLLDILSLKALLVHAGSAVITPVAQLSSLTPFQ